ncbi:transposase [Endozoicomonas sp. ONNA1]|uniref:transposase n=2 Tax=unclassified Endozoicomonas TaxID=2644528 RepID=UPI0021474A8B|nr:transposase [Endozoicomonas sp. ONNA1]
MTNCTSNIAHFPRCKSRQVQADFTGGDITSNAGELLLRQLDRKLQLSKALAKIINDPRDTARCLHKTETVVKQRLYVLVLGYEDLNDHQQLRYDLALQTATDSEHQLASQSTLCRFEKHANGEQAVQMHEILIEQFLASFRKPPKKNLVPG